MLLTIGLCLAVMGQDVLPGSNLSLKQAKDEAPVIVVAKVVKTGGVIIVGAQTILTGVELKPLTFLKGSAKDEELDDLGVGSSGDERNPVKGEEFIFFLIFEGNYSILKILPKTNEDLREIKAP